MRAVLQRASRLTIRGLLCEQERECCAHRAYGDRCEGGTKGLEPTSSYCFSRCVLETPDGQRGDGFPIFPSLRRGADLVPQPRDCFKCFHRRTRSIRDISSHVPVTVTLLILVTGGR